LIHKRVHNKDNCFVRFTEVFPYHDFVEAFGRYQEFCNIKRVFGLDKASSDESFDSLIVSKEKHEVPPS
jgi:hypothetical protein